MSVSHEDLVAFALGNLDAAESLGVRDAIAADPEAAAEFEAVRGHMAFHDRAPEIRPEPALWEDLRGRLDETAQRTLLQRFWMPAAAAALVLAALFLPREAAPQPVALHGTVARTADSWTADGVARMKLGNGVTVTLDDGTTIVPLPSERLALRAGRVFLEVEPNRRGFRVLAGDLVVTTTGTSFLVGLEGNDGYAFVESGRVRCEGRGGMAEVGADGTYGAEPLTRAKARAWFTRPTITAKILDETTVRIVVRNEMPDPIELAPPTGGERFFFASYGGHHYPLGPSNLDAPLALAPDTERSFDERLPLPLKDGEALVVSYPARDVAVEATR